MRRWRPLIVVLVAATAVALVVARARGQAPEAAFVVGGVKAVAEPRLAGLQWRFVRVEYHANSTSGRRFRMQYWGEPWSTDGPAADQNLTRRVRTATSLEVGEPVVMSLEDPEIWKHPWIYFVEPGNLEFTEANVAMMREFLLRGGTATFDDFHGPFEWENLATQLKRVFPDRPIVEVERTHPIFSCFYKLDGFPQIPGLGSFLNGRTWEKGGFVQHLRAIYDDRGRPMVLINWNTDMGDGWEWSNAEEYPGYLKYTRMSYRMAINEIVYVLTH
jgi:hypothetical protein